MKEENRQLPSWSKSRVDGKKFVTPNQGQGCIASKSTGSRRGLKLISSAYF
jgi:hypothetical protein